MTTTKDIFLVAIGFGTMMISLCALIITWRMRKKDFQISVHKEQLHVSQKLIDEQVELHRELIGHYQFNVAHLVSESGDLLNITEEQLRLSQAIVFQRSAEAYNKYLRVLQFHSIILPNAVTESGYEFLLYVGDLFENNNDSDLGVKLHSEVYEKINDTVNAVRRELGIDHLSDVNRSLLSKRGM